MNLLQSIDEKVHGPVLVTLNPPFEPKPELTAGAWSYDHPLYSEKVRRVVSFRSRCGLVADDFVSVERRVSSCVADDSE